MTSFLITYDLIKEPKRPPLLKDLKAKYPDWAKLSESSYAVVSGSTPAQIHNSLKHHLDGNDVLYVLSLSRPFAGQGAKDVNDWLAKNLDH